MWAFRRSRRQRRRRPRGRRRLLGPALLLIGSLSGAAATGALLLWVRGVHSHPAPPRHAQPPAPRSAPLYRAAQPRILPRSTWLNATVRRTQPPPRYDDAVVAVFVHHTDSPNTYRCADTPEVIRRVYAGQTTARKWDDIGYNFLVDRCGTIYEGRAGGVERAVIGAHSQGFNHRTAGIAAIGTFTRGTVVPRAMTDAIAALIAWKLGLSGVDPRSAARLVSSNALSRYPVGAAATLPAVSGHDAGYRTSCPGAALTARLPEIRKVAARLQGRR
ncbi:peptidoglycan recognition protein [Streptomyces sp. NPDC056161]|uniref:peptidoglycan recognition protein family protein n=1 Tax=Streptomyces sp. NPDC056161 TaxID=3345732 RepID=UPI0035E064B5